MGPSKILQTRLQNLILCKHTIEESAISQIPFIKALPIFRCKSFRKNLNDMFTIFRPISSSLLLFCCIQHLYPNNIEAYEALETEYIRISSSEFEAAVNAALLSDTVADATKGPFISEEGALNLSAVWACVRILSKPNSYTSRFALLHHLMVSCTLWGNGYARTTLQSVLTSYCTGTSYFWLA